jgi:hypothetical protein
MKLLDFLAGGFIDTFGITRPDSGEKQRATRLILLMIVGVVVFVAAAFGVVVMIISR